MLQETTMGYDLRHSESQKHSEEGVGMNCLPLTLFTLITANIIVIKETALTKNFRHSESSRDDDERRAGWSQREWVGEWVCRRMPDGYQSLHQTAACTPALTWWLVPPPRAPPHSSRRNEDVWDMGLLSPYCSYSKTTKKLRHIYLDISKKCGINIMQCCLKRSYWGGW